MHSIDHMHGYMHDPMKSPNPKEIKQSWDRWYGYLKAIHEAISGT